jgi:hypothetical protein
MKKRNTKFMLVLVSITAAVGIQAKSYAQTAQSYDQCDNCAPTPVGPDYSTLDKMFEQGVQPTAADLEGNWKMIVTQTLPAAADVEVNDVDAYDPAGIRLVADNSPFVFLSIHQTNDDFSGQSYLGVLLQNLGETGLNQGPNTISFSGQAACFAQYPYNTSGESSDQVGYKGAFIQWECRLDATSHQKMICALIPQGDPSQFIDSQKPFIGVTTVYRGYVTVTQ